MPSGKTKLMVEYKAMKVSCYQNCNTKNGVNTTFFNQLYGSSSLPEDTTEFLQCDCSFEIAHVSWFLDRWHLRIFLSSSLQLEFYGPRGRGQLCLISQWRLVERKYSDIKPIIATSFCSLTISRAQRESSWDRESLLS